LASAMPPSNAKLHGSSFSSFVGVIDLEQPNELVHARLGGRTEVIKRGADDLSESAKARTRTPPGHPEGYLEAFANLYAGFAEAIHAKREKREPTAIGQDIPTALRWPEGRRLRRRSR